MTIRFVIPGEPKGQGRPRAAAIGGHARMYKAKKDALYENRVSAAGHKAMGGAAPLSCACVLTVEARFPIVKSATKKMRAAILAGTERPAKRPDLDNIVKAVLDGLNAIAFSDDALVTEIRARKVYAETPCVIVQVEPWQPKGTAK